MTVVSRLAVVVLGGSTVVLTVGAVSDTVSIIIAGFSATTLTAGSVMRSTLFSTGFVVWIKDRGTKGVSTF